MRVIIRTVMVLAAAFFSFSASACESCSCDVCLMEPERHRQGSPLPPTNTLSISYCAANYGSIMSGTTIKPATGAGLYIGTVQLYYQHVFDNSLRGVVITPFINRVSSLNNIPTDSSSGIGDVTGLLRYTVMQGSDYTLTVQAGLKTNTGIKKDSAGTSVFSPRLVVGTGSTDPLVGIIYTKNFDNGWNLSADTLYRITGIGYDGYQFGNILNWGVNGYYRLNDNLKIGMGLVGESAAPNTDTRGIVTGAAGVAPNTGLTLLFFQPVIQYISGNLSADLGYQAPLYRDMTGTQLAVDNRITGSVRIAF